MKDIGYIYKINEYLVDYFERENYLSVDVYDIISPLLNQGLMSTKIYYRVLKILQLMYDGFSILMKEKFPSMIFGFKEPNIALVNIILMNSGVLIPFQDVENTAAFFIANSKIISLYKYLQSGNKVEVPVEIVKLPFINKNLLILCADESSYQRQSYISSLSFINTKNYNIYYLGNELKEIYPYKIQGKLEENLYKIKFNIIFSEYCPYTIFTKETQEIIYNILTNNGLLITPNYNQLILNPELFTPNKEHQNFKIYNKK